QWPRWPDSGESEEEGMNRTAGALVVLAALGGCRLTDDPDGTMTACPTCKPVVPAAASPVWKQADSTTGPTYPASVLSSNARAMQTGDYGTGSPARSTVPVSTPPSAVKATTNLPAPVASASSFSYPRSGPPVNQVASASPAAMGGGMASMTPSSRA